VTDKISAPLVPAEGWHVLHLYFKIEYGPWQLLDAAERREAKTHLASLVQEIRATPDTQLLTMSVVSPKADLGFVLVTPDLHVANRYEKALGQSLGADVLTPVFGFYSLTERSEYLSTEEDQIEALKKEGVAAGSPEFEKRLVEIRERLAHYLSFRLYPSLPDWPVVCFYPMNKRRGERDNWYALDFAERKRLMAGHGRIGRTWHGKILQMITGATGIDDAEWGVTLFARDTLDLKGIVYEMRFDPVSARYAEFGEFYVGLQLPLDQLFDRLML
jgi:peroxiredoxin